MLEYAHPSRVRMSWNKLLVREQWTPGPCLLHRLAGGTNRGQESSWTDSRPPSSKIESETKWLKDYNHFVQSELYKTGCKRPMLRTRRIAIRMLCFI
jgi:hypothetical protein